MDNFLPITNGCAIPRKELPILEFPHFRDSLLASTAANGNIVQFFGYEENGTATLLAVIRKGYDLSAAQCAMPKEFPSLTAENWKFNLFEREIAEQFGIRPLHHPWFKPVRYHANWRGAPDVFGADYQTDIPGLYDYFRVEGEHIHEVAVGPVHAGIIEPGHFRFQCFGEKVLHLEIQLGYQHRGVERLLPTLPFKRLPIVVEGIAGDTTIGNSLCFAQAVESLSSLKVPDPARVVRTIALELERLACHVGDLGALSGDVAFNPPAAYYGRLRGEFLNLLVVLAGNRFGKGLVRPGGVTKIPTPDNVALLRDKIKEVRPEIIQVADLLFSAHSVQARFEGCGRVDRATAEAVGLVGVAGRASGLDYDAREFFPTEKYKMMSPCSYNRKRGGVYSRAWVRYEEICHSLNLAEDLLGTIPEGDLPFPDPNWRLAPDSFVVTVNEPWRGELSHCLLTDAQGKILRYKVKDPSFHNWTGLALALRNQEISDFPLNNKSFNLSYCGFDL
ncbi:MAG: hydrogenase [Desulfuromonadaceae bacterium]|nr:hydrogenase [Desulfuromonadaceae bacterium]